MGLNLGLFFLGNPREAPQANLWNPGTFKVFQECTKVLDARRLEVKRQSPYGIVSFFCSFLKKKIIIFLNGSNFEFYLIWYKGCKLSEVQRCTSEGFLTKPGVRHGRLWSCDQINCQEKSNLMDYRCILRINNDVTFIDSNTLQATWCRPSRYHLMSTECTNCTNNFNITTRTSCVFCFFWSTHLPIPSPSYGPVITEECVALWVASQLDLPCSTSPKFFFQHPEAFVNMSRTMQSQPLALWLI